jgi:hypothetical protein
MDGGMVLETEVEWLGRPPNDILLIHTTNVYERLRKGMILVSGFSSTLDRVVSKNPPHPLQGGDASHKPRFSKPL